MTLAVRLVCHKEASQLPPNHLSASMMAIYPQKERNRDGKILYVREVPSYTHKKRLASILYMQFMQKHKA